MSKMNRFFKICIPFICIAIALWIPLAAQQGQLLQTKDIVKVMKQVLDSQGHDKEMTQKVINNAFKVFIDQFDPGRIYLLEEEVQPFLNFKSGDIDRFMQQYSQGTFQEFVDLNAVIQKSILRAKKLRQSILSTDRSFLFAKDETGLADSYEDWKDSDLKRSFAKMSSELGSRIRLAIKKFIAFERQRYGHSQISGREDNVLKLFDKKANTHERQYLYQEENGKPMGDLEKDSLFAVHVLKALSNSLDAHTTILNPTEAYEMRLRLEKGIQGIGILFKQEKDGRFFVFKMLEKGPAANSRSIKIDDTLLAIDGQSVANKSIDELMEIVNGKSGTKVTLSLQRGSDKPYQVELTRAAISVNENRAKSSFIPFGNGIIGTIRLDTFYQGGDNITSEMDVVNEIKKLRSQGNLRGLILDFRENSGGFLSQAIKVTGLFITNGIVVISKYFNGEEHFYRDVDSAVTYDGPLIVLTSKVTASAAEIVAEALQDYGVALIVGDEHTYGKGTIQTQTVTGNQSSAYFKVTVGKYYTVSGKTPQLQGVQADIVVPSEYLHEKIGEEFLQNPLPKDNIAEDFKDTLADVPSSLKSWYIHYYMPTLQTKKEVPQTMLQTLRQNSQKRILANKDYQAFIKFNETDSFKLPQHLQLTETINVMKDMIVLEEKQH